jgi:haloalkane dehalogenase
MIEVERASDERFAGISGFGYSPSYLQWEGIRLAYVDAGSGPAVLLLHGEPTWSFLWRKVMPPLMTAGFRCIVPDLPGFGRSDKPVDDSWYSYDRHTAAIVALVDHLQLADATFVMHDWGGPIGLRVATIERPNSVSRLVVMDTGIFTGEQTMSDEWLRFRAFVARHPDVPIQRLIRGGCKRPVPEEVLAAYDAPFQTASSKAGARRFPELIPLTPDAPSAAAGRAVFDRLSLDQRPVLVLWADSDRVLPVDPVGRAFARLFRRADELVVIEDAGHFLQEDQGELVGTTIADWLRRTAR